MKKLFLLPLMVGCLTASGQVITSYGFGSYVGTYEEITDGTLVNAPAADETINNVAFYPTGAVSELTTQAGYEIGFEFEYNDIICNQFVVGGNGYITLGRDAVTVNPQSGAFMFAREGEGRINCFGVMPNADVFSSDSTQISYKLTGEAPNRVLTIQYKNWGMALDWWGDNVKALNMQMKLYEADSKIEFVFMGWNNFDGSSKSCRVGLRGGDDDFHCRVNNNDDWQNTTLKDSDGTIYAGDDSNIADGLTFSFALPVACEAPTAQPTDLLYTSTTNQISGSFATCDGADHYLKLLTTESALTQLPQNGTFYAAGDSLGNALVLAYDTTAVFETSTSLQGASTYYVMVMAANSFCRQGPIYNTDAPLTAAITTKPDAPASITVTAKTTDKITFSVAGNEAGNQVLVALSDTIYEPVTNFGFEPYIGAPEGTYAVGDYLVENGGKVVYIGGNADEVVVEGLNPGTGYYLRAFSFNDAMEYSTEVVDASAATMATLPYAPDLALCERYGLPVDWEETGGVWRIAPQNAQVGGEDEMQLECNVTRGNATTGVTNTLTTSPIVIDKRDVVVSFRYNLAFWVRFPGWSPYNEWAEGDTLALQVSKDGINYETVQQYTTDNHLTLDSLQAYAQFEGDLAAYTGDTLQVRIFWKTYNTSGARLLVERLSIDGREIPAIPVVSVSNVTYNSAVASWRGEQENYEVASGKVGDDWNYNLVTGTQVDLIDLSYETQYQVKVRGIVAEGDTTEWSEVVTFTTEPLPQCPYPTNLQSETTASSSDVNVSWIGSEEHISWDVRYRESSATSWTTIEALPDEYYTFTGLQPETAYLWTVRANCTMDRVSAWAAQERFTSGRSAISLATASSLKVAATNGCITIYNNGVFVKNITVSDLQGRIIARTAVNGSDNILLPLRGMSNIVVIKVATLDNEFIYKVRVR